MMFRRYYQFMQHNLITRFVYYFVFHLAFWFIVFELLFSYWKDDMEYGTLRNLLLGALLGTLFTILLHGVKVLSGTKKSR
jgi:hypothetical protein